MKKLIVVGIVLLFLGVTVAHTINFSVVKASAENEFVQVTSEACGVKGFGNTTVKLTRQQYQNLEQYLIEFRAQLNQTTTREEAVPLFKEAVVELNTYGLLPRGMSIERAQKLVLGIYQNPRYVHLLNKMQSPSKKNLSYSRENYLCLIAGATTNTVFRGPISTGLSYFLIYLMVIFWYFSKSIATLFNWLLILGMPFGYLISFLNPIQVLSIIGLGFENEINFQNIPANGWIVSIGINGLQGWGGDMYGEIKGYFSVLLMYLFLVMFYPGILGFSGIKISTPSDLISIYLGTSLKIQVKSQY